jgi:hypothetical protein
MVTFNSIGASGKTSVDARINVLKNNIGILKKAKS